jgi:release factor glutamine methyltransferase
MVWPRRTACEASNTPRQRRPRRATIGTAMVPASPAPTVDQLLREGHARLSAADALSEAALLLGHALQRSRAWLFAHARDSVDAASAQRYRGLLDARVHGTPVAHLLGRRGFWTLDLEVSPDTLIPRPETELLVEAALERLPLDRPTQVADLGTGSGAIALALASERPLLSVLATDLSAAALAVAARNAAVTGLDNVRFAAGDWYAPLAGQQFTLIASNPPYIADDDPHLGLGDLRFEPRQALASGADGLDALRTIIAGAAAHLLPAGWLLLEHGWQQGAAVRELLGAAGFLAVASLRDLEQRERVSLGQRQA